MEQYIYDKSNGLWYERDGDYYIPCLKLPETKKNGESVCFLRSFLMW